ncbi:phenylacetate--CoA ligase family protein [Algibacter pectinivorans]|uniref:Phenylacetate-CoA ligase n=1 Tax=Algibacter pectinivorans TaxID=870482 RepID=A0A1I1PD43_9FLAO|nr:phenylacetate--CoA ligase family protein [Algibacter pectinivorans]SFD07636.1 phenylacetate-CoA ligase [Algibacter pectinivorans]
MAGLKETIYNIMPHPIKFVLLNIKGYLNRKQRYNKQFDLFLEEYKTLWNADLKIIKQFQKEKLIVLLSEILDHSDWYSAKMNVLGITKTEILNNPFEVLTKIPILEKNDRKNNVESLLNNKRETAMVGHTSGTSGSPTLDYIDIESINASFAFWKRFHHTIGIKPNTKQVRFSGRLIVDAKSSKPPFWMYNYFDNQLLMSTYHLTESNLGHYINKLNAFKPELLDGYPSALYIVSKYINKHNLKLTFIPKAIAVTAETLYDYQREEIEKAFQCKVYNQYASSEGSPFITECTAGELHLNLDSGIFEFINIKGEPAKPGEIAKLVVTSFINYRTPLVRYSIEDTVLLKSDNALCSCGCQMPLIEKLIGREDDILWTEAKGFVGRMDTAYKGLVGINKGQIIQESPSLVIINLETDALFTKKMETQFLNNLKARLGDQIEYKLNKVDAIPLGANGKFVAVKRKFKLNL